MVRKRRVNGEYSLSFVCIKTERNEHSFPLVQDESVIEYDGQKYRVKKIREYTKGSTAIKEIQAHHTFFDIIDDYQYNTLTGTINIVQALNHVFSVTDWTWVNQGAFNSVEFENFGDKNALELFQIILERYGAEFGITGPNQITLKNQIGTLRDAQFRYRHNIKTIYKDIDSTNVSTYIKGFGKGIEAEYTSPNVSAYGIRHAPPVRDERFTTLLGLQEHLQKVLVDIPNIVIELEVVELKEQGISIHEYDLGDTIFLIHEDLGIDATVRILEYTDYPESFKSPSVVLANFKKSMAKVMTSFAQTSKTVKQLTDADGNLSLALKRLYRNTDHYSDHTGDWYISPDDPNAYVHIGAGGLDIHRGLARIERDDGYAIIIGGKANWDFDIQGHNPPYTEGPIETYYFFWRTKNLYYAACNFYSYRHVARYLKIEMAVGVESGAQGKVLIMDRDGVTQIWQLSHTNWIGDNGEISNLGETVIATVDLGVPTGDLKSFYVQLATSDSTKFAYARVIRAWLEG